MNHDPGLADGLSFVLVSSAIAFTNAVKNLAALTPLSRCRLPVHFQHGPGSLGMDDVTITSWAGFVDGGFETGSLSPWGYDNVYGVSFAGVVSNGCQGMPNHAGSFVWCDGATQGYDAINQMFYGLGSPTPSRAGLPRDFNPVFLPVSWASGLAPTASPARSGPGAAYRTCSQRSRFQPCSEK